MSRARITVLIVDDSAVVRQVLSARLSMNDDIEVLGCASDPIFAMQAMNRTWPDVVVLDIEMPRMDGITFLKKIMAVRPTPVVICSTLTQRGASTAMEALGAGAVSVVPKPTTGLKKFMEDDSGDIVAAVRAAAGGNPLRLGATTNVSASRNGTPPGSGRAARLSAPPASAARSSAVGLPATPLSATSLSQNTISQRSDLDGKPRFEKSSTYQGTRALGVTTDKVVAIGTSTGGTQALEVVLTMLPRTSLGIVIVQHMPERFTAAFADRLNALSAIEVREAVDGDRVHSGRALVAPGGQHMELRRDGARYRVRVFGGPPVNRHRPSVDVLFRSVARSAGRNAIGIIMTGMGDDGARGLLEMHRAGALTVAQDEATCVVHGMPKEAVRLGAVDRETPLNLIAEVIRSHG